MKRPYVLVGLLILLAGCAGQKSLAPDPFFGKTAISPPHTRSLIQQAAHDPYYAASRTSRETSVDNRRESEGDFPDPVASWESKGKRREFEAKTTSWDVPEEITSGPPSVRLSSYAGTSSGMSRHASNDGGRQRVATVASRWNVGSSRNSGIRTRIRPPEYVSPTSGTHLEHASDDEAPRALLASAIEEKPESNMEISAARPRERESVVRVMQPRAVATKIRPRSRTSVTTCDSRATVPTSADVSSSWQGKTSGRKPRKMTSVTRPTDLSKVVAGRQPRQIILPETVIDLRDLPDRGTRAARQSRRAGNIRLASHPAVSGARRVTGARPTIASPVRMACLSSPQPSSSSRSSRYGYDREHTRLRGKLEYSEVAKRWKLRYIPINGETDQHGGSVVLAESSLLAGLQKGDFIEVHGRLMTDEQGQWGYAPVYKVAQLSPLRQ